MTHQLTAAILALAAMSTFVVAAQTPTRPLSPEGAAHAQVLGTWRGAALVGTRYDNVFTGYPARGETPDMTNAYRVIADETVSLDEGTGIVHIAPAYGDLEVGRQEVGGPVESFNPQLGDGYTAQINENPDQQKLNSNALFDGVRGNVLIGRAHGTEMWGLSAGQQEQLLLRLNQTRAGKEVNP